MKCFTVEWDPKTGEFKSDVHMPETKEEMNVMAGAAARLLVAISIASSEHTEFACHKGCTFAALIDAAHKEFHREDPEEYHRVIESGQLLKSIVTGSQH